MGKSISELLSATPIRIISRSGSADLAIQGITFDSRQVRPGFIFVPLAGVSQDGHAYIDAAIDKGAVAVVGSHAITDCRVPYIQVENTHFALAYLSAAFYDFPARKLTVIGVTGTDGKTTTCNLIYQILKQAGKKAGLISTVNAIIGDELVDTGFHVTTPDAPDLQRYLAQMVAAGITHVVLEATSHGLAQHRVAACDFDIGVLTNITHEHLDFHKTFADYLTAKARLFSGLKETSEKEHGNIRLAVLNKDDPSFESFKTLNPEKVISYSIKHAADYRSADIHYDGNGSHFSCLFPGGQIRIDSKITGAFNVANILAAIATTVSGIGIEPGIAVEGIASMPGVPGRMELIELGQDFIAMVDFAHTPNALLQVLRAVREMTSGKVIVVFGSAGLRDQAKRALMAEVAIKNADRSILTAEDPRTESLIDILSNMAEAAERAGGREGVHFWRVPDRGEAIRKAVMLAGRGDIVVACGKGHEQSMCFGTMEYPWDDRQAVRAALAERLGIKGERMPELPAISST